MEPNVIDLSASDDDAADGPTTKTPSSSGASINNVSPSPIVAMKRPPKAESEEEIEILQVKNSNNALSDYPHAREDCVVVSFNENPVLYCAKCYCYVCDKPASTCALWSEHCTAHSKDHSSRQQRKLMAAKTNVGHSSAAVASVPLQPMAPRVRGQPTRDRASLQKRQMTLRSTVPAAHGFQFQKVQRSDPRLRSLLPTVQRYAPPQSPARSYSSYSSMPTKPKRSSQNRRQKKRRTAPAARPHLQYAPWQMLQGQQFAPPRHLAFPMANAASRPGGPYTGYYSSAAQHLGPNPSVASGMMQQGTIPMPMNSFAAGFPSLNPMTTFAANPALANLAAQAMMMTTSGDPMQPFMMMPYFASSVSGMPVQHVPSASGAQSKKKNPSKHSNA